MARRWKASSTSAAAIETEPAVTLAFSRPTGAPAAHPTKIETVLPERGFGAPGAIPQQPTLEQERLFRKQRLAAGYRLFARAGFDMGGAGHITSGSIRQGCISAASGSRTSCW